MKITSKKATGKLAALIGASPRRLAMPLMGYPGARLTNTSLKQNAFNWGVQCWSIYELVDQLAPDGIFFMMDLSVEAGALGLPVRYPLEDSPCVEEPLVQTQADLQQFMAIDILKDARVLVYLKTMAWMAKHINPVKGAYCIGPFTLAGLLMGAQTIALTTLDDPALVHKVVGFCERIISRYVAALFDHGADLLVILDPTAMLLSPSQFTEFAGNYIAKLAGKAAGMTALHVCGDTNHLIEAMSRCGVEGLSLDSKLDFPTIAARVKPAVSLIGNLDAVQVLRNLTPDQVRQATRTFLERTRPIANLIVSSSCDLPLDTPLDNIRAMIEETKAFVLRPPGP